MMIPSTTTTPVGQGIEVRDVDDDDGYYSAPELGGYNHHINEQTQQLSSSSSSLRDHSFNNTASLPLLRGRFLSAAASSLSSTTSHRGEGILHGLHQHHHNDDDGDMNLLYGVLKDDNTHGGGRDGPKSSPTSITSNQQQNIIIEDGITSTTTTKKEGDDGGGAAAATDMIRTGSNNNEDSSLYERSIRYKKVFKLHRRLRDNNSNTFYTTLCPNHHHHHPRHNVHNADNKAATTITSSTSTSGMRGITKYSGVVQGCDAKQQQEEDDHHAYKSPLTIPIKQHNTLTGTTAGLSSSSTLPTGIDNIIITSNVILPPHHPTPLAPHDDEVTPAVGNSEVPTVATTTTTTNQQQQQHHHQHQHGGSSLLVLSSSPSAAAAVATIPSAINNEFYSPKASSTTTGRRKGRPVGDNDEVYNTKPSTLPPKIIDKNKDSTKVGDINNGDDRSKKKHAAAAAASILSILKTEIFGLNPPCKDDVNTGRRPAFKQVLPDGRRLADLAVMPGRMEYSLTYGFMLCLDATLEELTYMPISCIVGVLGWIFLHRTPSPTQKSDMARIAILAVTTTIFMKYVDFSTVYHYIRGQSMMKLYVMFNTLETLERLVRHLGSAFSDTMLVRALAAATTTTGINDDDEKCVSAGSYRHTPKVGRGELVILSRRVKLILAWIFEVLYTTLHTFMHFTRLICLTVATVATDTSMFMIVVTNNLAEIKSTTFKRYDARGLFPIACSDMVERFYLAVDITIMLYRMSTSPQKHPMPMAEVFFWVGVMVFIEIGTDWFKFWCICKKNLLESKIFDQYRALLFHDVLHSRSSPLTLPSSHNTTTTTELPYRNSMSVSHGPTTRLCFCPLPLTTLILSNILLPNVPASSKQCTWRFTTSLWLCLLLAKMITSILTVGMAVNSSQDTENIPEKLKSATY